jgi:hypothetical protein
LVLGYTVLAAGWLMLLLAAPLNVLRAGAALAGLPRLRLPGWLGGVEVSPSSLLLVGFIQHHDWVLDAWVARALESVRARFAGGGVVGPVTLDGRALPALGPEVLRPVFSGSPSCLLVVGDRDWARGVGDTVALWGMERDPSKRLRVHPMLPVRLDKNLPVAAEGDTDPLVRAVRDLLPLEAGAPSDALVAALLRRQRVLLIVANLPERDETTRAIIRPGRPDSAAHALLVTSYTDELLDGARVTTIRKP